MNNKTVMFIHSSVRTLVRSSVDLFFRPTPSVLLLVRSVVRSFVPSFVLPSVCLFVRPSVRFHSFSHSFVLSAYSCVVRGTNVKQNHRRSSEHGTPFSWKFKTIYLLRKPTNNLMTKLDWKYAKIKTETGRRCPLSCFKMHEGINIKRNTFTANGDHGIVQWLFKAYHRKHWLKK